MYDYNSCADHVIWMKTTSNKVERQHINLIIRAKKKNVALSNILTVLRIKAAGYIRKITSKSKSSQIKMLNTGL